MKLSANIKKMLGLRQDMPLSFYLAGFFYQKILRNNSQVPWIVHHSSTVFHPEKIVRGKNVFPGDSPGNFIDASYGISIGDYTNLGPNVGLITKNHNLVDNEKYDEGKPINIGKYCWLGMNTVVLPGVTLGNFTIVGAGAVVTKSFQEGYVVIAGNPATIIKHLDKNACDMHQASKEK